MVKVSPVAQPSCPLPYFEILVDRFEEVAGRFHTSPASLIEIGFRRVARRLNGERLTLGVTSKHFRPPLSEPLSQETP